MLCFTVGFAVFYRIQVDRIEALADVQRENEIYCRAFEQDVSRSLASIDTVLASWVAAIA